MAARGGKTVDPAKITGIDSWIKHYKLKYANIALGDDGSLLVLDPTRARADRAAALTEPVKTIPHVKGADFLTELANPTLRLRAIAENKRSALITAIAEKVDTARGEFISAEAELLEAVDLWKAADDAVTRKAAAIRVGELSKKVADADAKMRGAAYPHRYVHSEYNISRKMVDYASHDDRAYMYPIYRTIPETTTPAGRTITEADMA